MSYLLNSIIYKPGMLDTNLIAETFKELRKAKNNENAFNYYYDTEIFCETNLKDDRIIFYWTESEDQNDLKAFWSAHDFMFRWSFVDALNNNCRKAGKPYEFYGLSYNNLSGPVKAAARFNNILSEKRYLSGYTGYISVVKNDVETESFDDTIEFDITPYVNEKREMVKEDEYFADLAKAEEPCNGLEFLRKALNLDVEEVIKAFHTIDKGQNIFVHKRP